MMVPGHLLDGKKIIHPLLKNYGSEILDKFNDDLNNLKFVEQYSATGMLLPWMLGITNRYVAAGEDFGFSYGRDYWRNKTHFNTLSKAQQSACSKYYAFKKDDLFKQTTPDEALLTPPKKLPAPPTASSSTRSSPARPTRTIKK